MPSCTRYKYPTAAPTVRWWWSDDSPSRQYDDPLVAVEPRTLQGKVQLLLDGQALVVVLEAVLAHLEHRANPLLIFIAALDEHDVGRPLVQPRADRLGKAGFQQLLQLLDVRKERGLDVLGGPQGEMLRLDRRQFGAADLADLGNLLPRAVALGVAGPQALAGLDRPGLLLPFVFSSLGRGPWESLMASICSGLKPMRRS